MEINPKRKLNYINPHTIFSWLSHKIFQKSHINLWWKTNLRNDISTQNSIYIIIMHWNFKEIQKRGQIPYEERIVATIPPHFASFLYIKLHYTFFIRPPASTRAHQKQRKVEREIRHVVSLSLSSFLRWKTHARRECQTMGKTNVLKEGKKERVKKTEGKAVANDVDNLALWANWMTSIWNWGQPKGLFKS